MKKKIAVIFLIGITLCFGKHDFASGGELTVVYTANTSGKLRSCNCPNDPYGGLAERVTLLKNLRPKEKPFLLVDGGNMVSLFGSYDLKASCVIRIMNLMEYDAAGAGWQEMFHGVNSALKMRDEAKFPLLSATIVKNSDGTNVFEPYIITKVGENSVGIISVCDSTNLIKNLPPKVNDYSFLSKSDILNHTLREISSKSDFIVVLSQLSPDENKKMLINFPIIDFIVESNHNKKYDPPVVTPDGVIVSPGRGGQFIGLITLEKSKTGKISIKRHEFLPVLHFPEDKKAHKICMEYFNSEN